VGQETFDARIAIRDQLLGAVIEHLRRRGDAYLAQLVDRIVGVVRAHEGRIEDNAALAAEVTAFARMDLSRGKRKPIPEGPGTIRAAKFDSWMVEGYLRTAEAERGPGEPLPVLIQEVWQEALRGAPPLSPAQVQQVLRLKTLEGKALRLVFWATRRVRRRQERFEDFRKQVSRYKVRPHPWIVS
jgi:hypothetical protein